MVKLPPPKSPIKRKLLPVFKVELLTVKNPEPLELLPSEILLRAPTVKPPPLDKVRLPVPDSPTTMSPPGIKLEPVPLMVTVPLAPTLLPTVRLAPVTWPPLARAKEPVPEPPINRLPELDHTEPAPVTATEPLEPARLPMTASAVLSWPPLTTFKVALAAAKSPTSRLYPKDERLPRSTCNVPETTSTVPAKVAVPDKITEPLPKTLRPGVPVAVPAKLRLLERVRVLPAAVVIFKPSPLLPLIWRGALMV